MTGEWGALANWRAWLGQWNDTSTDLLASAVHGRPYLLGRLGVHHQPWWMLPGVTASPHSAGSPLLLRWRQPAPKGLLSGPAGQPAGVQDIRSQGQLSTTDGGKTASGSLHATV